MLPFIGVRIYFENPVGRILEHPQGYAVVEFHAGKRNLSELQAFLRHAGQLLQRRSWNKLLGDQRLMNLFTPEESQWIVNYWLTRSNQGSDVYGAVILPHDVFARLSVSQVVSEAKAAAMTYRMFDSEEMAQEWLMQLP
ncbi:hypothetical protein MTX78_12040 [Hymenobacter tibetensis]|uniref:STAS/SEC14 domain-containing protein n=1 Tax=Hymenobacter tibetensis TaxID=497967 RepID=A0ABY4CRG4_9BACT|nr:hypothetical protein [Hymenobacter tibetensis]UOG72858.1 hypothetical protein MTX78_12040 [Hymenobacter tibetensis]